MTPPCVFPIKGSFSLALSVYVITHKAYTYYSLPRKKEGKEKDPHTVQQ